MNKIYHHNHAYLVGRPLQHVIDGGARLVVQIVIVGAREAERLAAQHKVAIAGGRKLRGRRRSLREGERHHRQADQHASNDTRHESVDCARDNEVCECHCSCVFRIQILRVGAVGADAAAATGCLLFQTPVALTCIHRVFLCLHASPCRVMEISAWWQCLAVDSCSRYQVLNCIQKSMKEPSHVPSIVLPPARLTPS
jgi:hypothetical protein